MLYLSRILMCLPFGKWKQTAHVAWSFGGWIVNSFSSESLSHDMIIFLFFFFLIIDLFIYFWLCWVFVSVRGPSLVVASRGHSSSWCAGPSPSWPLLLRSTGSRRAGSVVVVHRPSRSTACGILPDQGSNPCSLHWQADSQPLRHQGSPWSYFLTSSFKFPVFKIRLTSIFPESMKIICNDRHMFIQLFVES